MKKVKLTKKHVAETTISKIYNAMKKRTSKKTGVVNISRLEIATAAKVSPRTVDAAINNLKVRKLVGKAGMSYRLL
mgnify:CR=1 FL=1